MTPNISESESYNNYDIDTYLTSVLGDNFVASSFSESGCGTLVVSVQKHSDKFTAIRDHLQIPIRFKTLDRRSY